MAEKLANRIIPIIRRAIEDFHTIGSEERRFDFVAGASSTPFIVFTDASPKLDSRYLPSSVFETRTPRLSR